MLPAIVVTHDPCLSTYKWYKTCPDKIETQMNRLTGVANQMNHFKQMDGISLDKRQDILYKMLNEQELDLCNGSGITALNESVARALSDILSFVIQSEDNIELHNNRDRDVLRISKSQSNRTLSDTIKSLHQLQNDLLQVTIDNVDEHKLFPLIEDLVLKLGISRSFLNKKLNNSTDKLPINAAWLENDSLNFLKIRLEVEAFLQKHRLPIDYSPSAICMGKMFEKEINLSFVHWVRKQHSIELPKYFNRFQPGVKALVSVVFPTGESGTPVDFNAERNGMWQPPELGKSKTIAKFKLTDNDWKAIGIDNQQILLSEWDKIHRVRNMAAHGSKLSLNDLKEMKNTINRLAANNMFEKLATLKNTFRNPVSLY